MVRIGGELCLEEGEDTGVVPVWLLPPGITLMSRWQREGNSGVKHRFQCPGSRFRKGPLLCLGPDLSPAVSTPHVWFSVWQSADRVGVTLARG